MAPLPARSDRHRQLALNPVKWVVAMIVVCEIGGLALIVTGLYAMMSDDDEAQPSS